MLSDRGGARLGVRAVAGFEDVESGACEFEGAELEGLEFCAHTTKLHANAKIKRNLRISLFYSPSWVARNACKHLCTVSNSENWLPSCSTR
jgi:hypothetical protein